MALAGPQQAEDDANETFSAAEAAVLRARPATPAAAAQAMFLAKIFADAVPVEDIARRLTLKRSLLSAWQTSRNFLANS